MMTSAQARDASTTFTLHGQVALVTGASSGLGRRFATVLAQAGAQVVASGRRGDKLSELAAEVPGLLPVIAELRQREDRQRLVATVLERFGRLDLLVNNAGISLAGPAEHDDLDGFTEVLEVNLVAAFHLCQLAVHDMIRRGSGVIVNIASIMGLVASAPIEQAAYCASKGGLVNLTRELAVQWARKGIRVNALAPGFFPSELTQPMLDNEASRRYIQRSCPMGRPGREEELDGALLFLASDASSYCTGQILAVDGGWVSR